MSEKPFACPVYKRCGGCQLDVIYPQQLSYKQRTLRSLLGSFGKIEPIMGMDDPLHYRCKISTAFGYSGGRILSGVWQSSSGRLTAIEGCGLEHPAAEPIIKEIKSLLAKYKLHVYNDSTGKGFLRFVTIRVGRQTGQILVALGTGAGEFPKLGRLVDDLVSAHPEITTVVRAVSTSRLNLILGQNETVLYGPGYIEDRISSLRFRISARSFFQVNPTQAERLYATAIEMAELRPTDTAIDAYCGVGAIGLLAAGSCSRVLAVESNGDAVENARENAELNGIKNIRFTEADAGRFMSNMAARGEHADVVFTDPPRAGCSREFLASLVELAPDRVVYISCNPETQARDLRFLTKQGYRVCRIRAVDMFPYTRHIETVCLLSKLNAKKYPDKSGCGRA